MQRSRLPALVVVAVVLGSVTPALAQGTVSLTVEVLGSGTGSVATDPVGISCPGTCTATFPEGATVLLAATADQGSVFVGWGGACTGTEACSLTLDRERSVTARFDDGFRPDLMIRKPGSGVTRGRGMVAAVPGLGQTVGAPAGRGDRVTFTARAVNAGASPDTVVLSGTGDRGGASVRYVVGGRDVTDEVVAGALEVRDLAPGDGVMVKIVVSVSETASIGARRAWTLSAASLGDPGSVDAVRAQIRVVWRPVPLARAVGVTLVEPAREVVFAAYHQSLFDSAAALEPLGDGIVMESRGRGTPPTSAVDVVMEAGERVLAPVTGRVLSVTSYRLYCDVPDVRVVIRPADDPARTVLLLHVQGVHVSAGDRVVAGRSAIGRPRDLGYDDQVDDHGAAGRPHVHLEIERDGSSPLPGCR